MNAICGLVNADTMKNKLVFTRARGTTPLPAALRAMENNK